LQPQPRGNPLGREALRRQYGNFKKPEGGFGPEFGLARTLRAKEGKPLAIVKVAFSGTGLRTDWNHADSGDNGACYRALISETKAAIAAAKAQDISLRPRALVWVQGESDSNPADAPNYERALGALIAALRKDLEAPQLIALLGVNTRFGNGKNLFVPKIVEAQKALASKDARCIYVDTAGAETLPPSHTHFTAAGTLEVGNRFAEALRKIESTVNRN
jgi:lysophospholipase L1-like esterase